jgi:hypothetical protein
MDGTLLENTIKVRMVMLDEVMADLSQIRLMKSTTI